MNLIVQSARPVFHYGPTLMWEERIHHRDQLRAARYAALADAEGFSSVCFALEALGLRLLGKKEDLGKYKKQIWNLANDSVVLSKLSISFPSLFGKFSSLYELVRSARNDAMHTGVYARHATAAAIELCIGLEEAIMKEQDIPRTVVEDFMVKSPISVEPWQPVAHARQLMLTHSFSFLPVLIDDVWMMVSELGMARYLRSGGSWKKLLATPIEFAYKKDGLSLIKATIVNLKDDIHPLLNPTSENSSPNLWLVEETPGKLCGVISPFELM
jgi:CBS domain-containing protein